MKNGSGKNDMEQIGFEYVKLLLEVKYGCKVRQVKEGQDGSVMQVWSPRGYQRNTLQVNIESGSAEMVAVQVAHIINGRPVAILVDYHLIKFIGIEGAYSLEEEKLQQLLLDEKYVDKVTSEDGGKMYALFPKQLLLDHCSFIAA